jgi:exonuclease SbcC
MILLELEIENYKQFRGKHVFAPSPTGVIGVIGANGAGKTTLFEAVEWCLYQPSSVRAAEIPPRDGQELRPRVRIRLNSPREGTTYELERKLGKTGAIAEVRQIDDGGQRVLCSGSGAVSKFVASRLIGLPHDAFVATFFTRQKELSFFGSLGKSDRRREVNRLLGLETIRTAQEIIAGERRDKEAVYKGLQQQYEQESGARDFEAERAARNAELAEIDPQITAASTELVKAEKATREADAARSKLVEQRETTLRLQEELATHKGTIATADAAIKTATDELARIDQLELQRPALEQMIAELPTRRSVVAGLESDRDRASQRKSLSDQLDQVRSELDRLAISTRAHLPTVGHRIAEADPLTEIDSFLADTEFLDAAATEQAFHQLKALADDQKLVADLEAKLERYRTGVREIEQQQLALLAQGDPVLAEETASDHLANSLNVIATYKANIESHDRSLADYRLFANGRHEPTTEPICRMCGRPITPEDSDHTRRHAEERIVEIEAEIGRLQADIVKQESRAATLEADIREIRVRADALTTFGERIRNGQRTVAETGQELERVRETLNEQMRALNRTEPVTEAELAAQQDRSAHERAVEQKRAALVQLRGSLATSLERHQSLSAQVAAIGDVDYDPATLAAARAALDEALTAEPRLTSIDQQLARRADHTAVIETATATRTDAQTQVERLEAEIAANPIDEFALEKAGLAVEMAQQQERLIRSQRDAHQRARISIEHAVKAIDTDQKRIEDVARRADEARVEAGDLDRMYKEFDEFDRYASDRVRPPLEDMTTEFVRIITEDKYDSVSIDRNYGIKVWDGELGPYPVEDFSGGERDVIALSARLALSRLIGSQAANPPSFLVLDEVFGSLDRDRRGNVIDLLSSLAGSAESFQQLFVISHVDDVRLSPAFNEVWRVAETDDGGSRLENLNLTQSAEDL